MKFIDPTYLRYVHNGLQTGSVDKENVASLPFGLIGIYESIFSNSIALLERKKLLDFFTVWAVLKKEVSTSLVADILCWREDDVLNYINEFSRWFNSVTPNKYVLYHQSLVAFVLQFAPQHKLKKIIDLLTNLNTQEAKEYCETHLNDHNYSLSFIEEEYSKKCIEYIDLIRKRELSSFIFKDYHQRAFIYASLILSYKNEIYNLSRLYTNYDDLINSEILIKNEHINFQKYGIEFLINKGYSFHNCDISFIYWIYFLNYILTEDESNDISSELIKKYVNHINSFVFESKNLRGSLITSKYLSFLNEKLFKKGITEVNYKVEIEGIPRSMNEVGHLDDIDRDITNLIISDTIDDSYCMELLQTSISYIDTIPDAKENSTIIAEKIFTLIFNDNSLSVTNFLKKLKNTVLVNTEVSIDEYYNYDDLVFHLFIIFISKNPTNDYSIWSDLFITSHKYYQRNMSFLLMLKKIQAGGDVESNYRNYLFSNTKINNLFSYQIDEMSSIMFVLSSQSRNDEIRLLLMKFLENISSNQSYDYYSDILASCYFRRFNEIQVVSSIRDYYSINKGEASVFQLSSVLCQYVEFLDLIAINFHNIADQSEITENYNFTFTITNAIYNRLGSNQFLNYVLNGFEKYISIMGKHALYDHLIPEQLPLENIWRIEWWIMSNVYASIDLNSEIENFIKEKFIQGVKLIFRKYNCDINMNLNAGILKYKDYRVSTKYKIAQNFEYDFHENPIHYLRIFSNLYLDRVKIGKIAGSIKNNTISKSDLNYFI